MIPVQQVVSDLLSQPVSIVHVEVTSPSHDRYGSLYRYIVFVLTETEAVTVVGDTYEPVIRGVPDNERVIQPFHVVARRSLKPGGGEV